MLLMVVEEEAVGWVAAEGVKLAVSGCVCSCFGRLLLLFHANAGVIMVATSGASRSSSPLMI